MIEEQQIAVLATAVGIFFGAMLATLIPGFPWWALIVGIGGATAAVFPFRTHRKDRRH